MPRPAGGAGSSVDPVSHAVMGRVVVAAIERAGRAGASPGMAAASVAGALIPDIDLVLMPFGWDVYLRFHEVGTHSIAGACVLGGLVAGVVRQCVPAARWRTLAWAAALAALSHLLLDVVSGARVAPAWPLVSTRASLPLVAMAEAWLASFFALAAIALWRVRAPRHRTAGAVLLLLVVLLGLKGLLYARVLEVLSADPRLGSRTARMSQARWGTWRMWHVYERHPDALRVWRVDAVSRTIAPVLEWPVTSDSPLIGRSRSLDTVSNFLRVHELGFAIERRVQSGATEVLWSDIRFCRQGAAGADLVDCALWLGGVFDPQGRPVTQVVRLPWWTQWRRP
jgi:membrane-bound metal-dependent hydrolase YbcI (DUF457 family)